MKKLLLFAGLLGLALLGLIWTASTLRAKDQALRAQVERDRLVREFTERAALARAMPADAGAAWTDEANALVRGHVEALADLRARFPGLPAAPSAVDAAAAERKGKLDPKVREELEAAQRYAEERFAPLRQGKYAPVASAVAGGLRLDLLPPQSGLSPAGRPGLRLDFALWGPPRLVGREKSGEGTVTRVYVPVSLRTLSIRFLKADGKEFARLDGPGEPYQKLSDPERFLEDFPPGLLVGTWWLPLLPRDAERLELQLDADVRGATGSNRPAGFTFALPVEESWRAPPGTEPASSVGH